MAELSVREMARLGGKARAKKMTAEERSESARKAVQARWAKADKLLKKLDDAEAKLDAARARRPRKKSGIAS